MRDFYILFLAGVVLGHPADRLPSFSFEASRSGGAPTMRVNLPSGESHRVDLTQCNTFRDISASSLDCAFLGSLENEPQSSVAVTGCLGAEPLHVTVVSDTLGGQFEVATDGTVSVIPDPFVNDSHNDIYVDSDDAKLPADSNRIIKCTDNPEAEGCKLPEEVTMELAAHYDQSLQDEVGENNVTNWINQVVCHAQVLFYKPSFPTKLKLQVVGDPVFHPGKRWSADKDLGTVRQLVVGNNEVDVHAFFVHEDPQTQYPNPDNPDWYLITTGMAYPGSLCLENYLGRHVNINEKMKSNAATGKLLAHELGHNLGAPHDFSFAGRDCTGVMDYGDTPDTWSACSQETIRDAFARVVQNNDGQHCMEYVGSAMRVHFCELRYKGDGECDMKNNNAECQFDGGDCCNNTKPDWDKYCKPYCACLE